MVGWWLVGGRGEGGEVRGRGGRGWWEEGVVCGVGGAVVVVWGGGVMVGGVGERKNPSAHDTQKKTFAWELVRPPVFLPRWVEDRLACGWWRSGWGALLGPNFRVFFVGVSQDVLRAHMCVCENILNDENAQRPPQFNARPLKIGRKISGEEENAKFWMVWGRDLNNAGLPIRLDLNIFVRTRESKHHLQQTDCT